MEHLESFIHRGHTKNQHDRFHKPGSRTKDLPSFGNWNLSFFAFLLAGEVIGPQETSKEATYGAAIEGWISVLHDEEEDDLIGELLDSVIQGLTVVMELFEETPSQLHDVVHWKTNEPDFDRVMRHFYPREIPRGMEPKSAPKRDRFEEDAPEWEDRREQPQGSRGPDPEVEWTEDETWEEDWESTDREEQGAEETAPETPAPSHLKTEQDDTLALEALGIYEDRVERVEAANKAPPQSPQAKQSQRFAPYHFDYPPRKLEYKYDTKVSKRLSVVLRHDKGEFNLHFFNNATAEVDAILDLPIMREVGARQDTLISCVYYNSKQRFRLLWLHDSSRSGPTLVLGAVQGHSKAVDYDSVHERVDPDKVPALIHGTHYDFYKKIFKEGLLPGAGSKEWRDQLHLLAASTDLNSNLLPPKCDIVLHINPALATGCRFYKSANGYYLTGEPIGPQAISAVTIRETRERVEAEEEGSPPLPSIVLQALLRNQLGGRRQTANAQSSDSSHRRAYMALWQLVRLGCSFAHNLPTLWLTLRLQELRSHWRSRPPTGGADGRKTGLTKCPATGLPQSLLEPICATVSRQDMEISRPQLQGWEHCVEDRMFLPCLFAIAVLTAAGLLVHTHACRRVHAPWRTQRRIHGFYRRRPQTQQTLKHSMPWQTSRVGPKSDGPAQYFTKMTSFEPRLGEVRVPPGPPTGGEPNSGSKPRSSQGGGATQHRITTQGSTKTPCPDSPRRPPAMAQNIAEPLAHIKLVRLNPNPCDRVEVRDLPYHSGCSW